MARKYSYQDEVYGGGSNPQAEPGRVYDAIVTSGGVGGVMVCIDAPDLPSTSRDIFAPRSCLPVGAAVRVRIRISPAGRTEAELIPPAVEGEATIEAGKPGMPTDHGRRQADHNDA